MKNIFLLFLSLVLSSIAYAGAPQLPDDVLSGLTYTEANITKEFPDYMMNVVDKSDGHPVRLGDKSIRFEVRSGDCFDWAIGGSSDCTRYPLIDFQGDRERYELATDVFKKKEHWFSWSIYFPEDYKNNWPLKNLYGQFHEKDGGNVIWSFEQYPNGIVLTKEKGLGGTEMKQFTVLGNNELPGRWHDFLIHAKFSKNDDGFLKVWVNDKLMADYRGVTESTGKVFHKFGIYRTGITRFHNQNNLEGLNKCIKENEGLSWAETAVRAFSNNWEVNFNWSKVLYEKCNSYYDEIEIPTDIVYYDEVRRADSCEGLGLLHDCANLAILNQKQLMLVDKIKSQANKKILAKVGKKNKKEVKGWVDTQVNIWTEEPNFFQQLGSSKSRKEALNSFIAEGIQKFK
jgi:hypothetical protein